MVPKKQIFKNIAAIFKFKRCINGSCLKAASISSLGPWCQVPMPIVGILAPLFKVTHFLSEFIFCPFFVEASEPLESGIKLIASDYFESTYILLFCVHVYIFWVHMYINGLFDLLPFWIYVWVANLVMTKLAPPLFSSK